MDKKIFVCAVLGAGNDKNGTLCSDAIQRCDLALELIASNSQTKVILCGGFGEHFNTTKKEHYHYLKSYMETHLENIDEYLLGCVESYNTIADIQGINKLLQPFNGEVELTVITNDYHVLRASVLVNKIITQNHIGTKFLSVSSQKNILLLQNRLKHEFSRINEYLNNDFSLTVDKMGIEKADKVPNSTI